MPSDRDFDGHSFGSQGSSVSSGGKLRWMHRLFESSLYTHANLYLMLDTFSLFLSEKTLQADASLECELCKLVMEELIKIVGQNKSLVSIDVP